MKQATKAARQGQGVGSTTKWWLPAETEPNGTNDLAYSMTQKVHGSIEIVE